MSQEVREAIGYWRMNLRTWSNKAAPLDAALFEKERKAAARTTPFASGDELKALATKTP